MVTFKKEEGLSIAQRRQELGLSQAALAKSVGLSRSYITQIENGSKKPSGKALFRILLALDLCYTETYYQDENGALQILNLPMSDSLRRRLEANNYSNMVLYFEDIGDGTKILKTEKIGDYPPIGPNGWTDLSKEDRRLVQRIVNRLLKKEGDKACQEDS